MDVCLLSTSIVDKSKKIPQSSVNIISKDSTFTSAVAF